MTAPAETEVLEPTAAVEVMRECLRAFGAVRFRVTGECMAPDLPAGSIVTVSSQPSPRLGDVVLVHHREGMRLHRLVVGPPLWWKRTGWRTKGDRLSMLDPPLAAADVLGTVIDPRPRAVSRALGAWAAAAWAHLRARLRA